jgi:hypothetical protein
MLYIILLLLIFSYILYLIFKSNGQNSVNNRINKKKINKKRREAKTKRIRTEREEKAEKERIAKIRAQSTEKFQSSSEENHYGAGLMIPQVGYKADTVLEDTFLFDIAKQIEKSKATNIYKLYKEIVNDNYYLFNTSKDIMPNQELKPNLYQNTYYNPKTEKKSIFSTGLPKIQGSKKK